MKYRLKILFISLFLSLPFWWTMNIFANGLEDIWFYRGISVSPQLLTAQASNLVLGTKPSIEIEEVSVETVIDRLDDSTKAAFSVEIDPRNRKDILFDKNSQKQLPIASLTKLMTALVVFDLDETYDFSQSIKISESAVNQEGASKYGEIKEGQLFSLETLINMMLIESSNDVAYAIGEVIGEQAFVDLMNQYALKIGLQDTYFANLTGLDPDDVQRERNTSTAKDIVKLAEYILKNYPQIFEITAKDSYKVFDFNKELHHFIPENTNDLLGEIKGIIGGKTGWSIEARGCLLIILENSEDNSYIFNVILGAYDRFEEMRKLINLVK